MPHIHEAIDFIVSAYIVHGGKVLLINHRKLERWLPVGGHIELDENPEQALFREVEEETGLTRSHLKVLSQKPTVVSPGTTFLYTPNFLDIHDFSPSHRHIGLVYFLRSNTDKVILAEKEHSDIKWLGEKDIDTRAFNLSEAVKFYIKEAFKTPQ
ncbi:MAG: hypothetical protein A3F33_02420 [Candidatus Woykebacteria bacterium RIFCSPHIGHO2_12_FULL_43_10]|uniref:Nudix hydrolase domain-containing protein n=1 Tax=Candidatus Woykebacteria bacterium RIFCSPHIGHO2_02_FULL_43_16b TaxID=1802601 RepID=A0A1G1WRL9_9BACT|nr:MAG: hypothetical protein A2802_00140 [Candidatus Woykebacteria bacterium RIFCSPHIGHO2_01_FULL_43_29]OGY28620.1 MAG: hypothetical protein A3F33_02420 [Candidatus Woykebacteria bacterium RIFCSPHIGHO2_12_FULL_43_10]OGY29970.1 MAG: hypothetical protein A3J50_02710 [Candidatus Woykebacteria bacterium RIFCSPHIGHO2_02_FULL_43_16b]